LARCTSLLIDKTGTLTRGRPALVAVVPAGPLPPHEILALAGSLDQVSPHVLAHAVVEAAEARHCRLTLPEQVVEVAGQGIQGVVNRRQVALGKAAWVGLSGVPAWAKTARRRAQLDGSMTCLWP
jgi:cation transport ATPase